MVEFLFDSIGSFHLLDNMEPWKKQKLVEEEVETIQPDSPVNSEEISIPFDSLRISYNPNSKNKTKAQREFEQLQRMLHEDSSPGSEQSKTPFDDKKMDIDFINATPVQTSESINLVNVVKKDDLETFMSQWEELSELFDYQEFEQISNLEESFKQISKGNKWLQLGDSFRLEIIQDCLENIEIHSKTKYLTSLKCLLYISLGTFEMDSKKIQIYQMKENFKLLSKTIHFNLILDHTLFYCYSVM
jgi:hypothetical protein